MTDTIDKAFKLLTFLGKQKDWCMWRSKFLARSQMKKYYGVLMGQIDVPPESDDIGTSSIMLLNAQKWNEVAYVDMMSLYFDYYEYSNLKDLLLF